MKPVQPGWVAVPAREANGEWFHVVGWTKDREPVCAGTDQGVFAWHEVFGEDPYIIATHKEWLGDD